MTLEPKDHPASHDEADRLAKPRRVPAVVAVIVAVAVLTLLWFLHAIGVKY